MQPPVRPVIPRIHGRSNTSDQKLAVYDNEKWNTIPHGVIHDLVKAKFMQNDDMAQELIRTGNRKLVETGNGKLVEIGKRKRLRYRGYFHSSQCA